MTCQKVDGCYPGEDARLCELNRCQAIPSHRAIWMGNFWGNKPTVGCKRLISETKSAWFGPSLGQSNAVTDRPGVEVRRTEQGPRKLPFNEKKPAQVANPRSIRDHAEQLASGALQLAESGGSKHVTGGTTIGRGVGGPPLVWATCSSTDRRQTRQAVDSVGVPLGVAGLRWCIAFS
jgi:hypothetical protein